MRKIGAFLARFWADTDGASASEYAIILSAVVAVTILGVLALTGALQGAMTNATNCLNTTTSGC